MIYTGDRNSLKSKVGPDSKLDNSAISMSLLLLGAIFCIKLE